MTLYSLLEKMTNKVRNNTSSINAQNAKIVNLESLINNINNTIYPVGSIYMSVNSVSPAELFGGIWERIENAFLFGASNTILPGTISGEFEHILTIDEMPSHSHLPTTNVVASDVYNTYSFVTTRDLHSESTARVGITKGTDYYTIATNPLATDYVNKSDITSEESTATTGNSQSHNNMPPYLAVYIWKRIK